MNTLSTWIEVPPGHDFSIYNLPFGIFSTTQKNKRLGIAIGDWIIDLVELQASGLLGNEINPEIFSSDSLNLLMDLGKLVARGLRNKVQVLLSTGNESLKNHPNKNHILLATKDCLLHLPVRVGDYTDFYSSIEHATNVGKMFRDPANALLPNWKHIPVGYHGRASSIVVSGTPIRRPKGQTKSDDQELPVFGPSRLLDFELETAFITCGGNELGTSISTHDADDNIWGMVLFNDWSARDIQKWEYVPLGPFLGKNFGSSISPWVVFMDALEPFRVAGPTQEPKVLPYLSFEGEKNIDLNLEVTIKTEAGAEQVVSRSNFKYMYWNMNQQLAHQTVNGCNIRTGDVYGSGTISGPEVGSFGSMLEITWSGKNPIQMPDGTERKFILDGDSVIFRGYCEKNGIRVGFGELVTKVLPAI